jgi:hypothetical protein
MFSQIFHRAQQILHSMRVKEVLEGLRLHVRVLFVVQIVRDVRLSVGAVVLVEPGSHC